MKSRMIFSISLTLIILLAACNNTTHRNSDEILVSETNFEFVYYDLISGKEFIYSKQFSRSTLKDVLNDWINEMVILKVDYGSATNGKSILENLYVNDVEIFRDTVVIDFNSSFLEFNKPDSEAGYFLIGLERILMQTISAKAYTITIDGSDDFELIDPDGIKIKEVELK